MTKKAILAGGCFWGMEELFRNLPGVTNTIVGYTGGSNKYPRYEDVKTGQTGHAEGIEITYDDEQTSFSDILRFFFKIHDPTSKNRQGNDIGTQYRSTIFFLNEKQQQESQAIIAEIDESKKWPLPIITTLEQFIAFYPAEEVHQKYLMRNPGGYTCHFVRD